MLNDKVLVKGVLGDKQSFEALAKDTDKDSYVDPVDCQPNNANKQGFVHNLINKARGSLEASRKARAEQKEKDFVTRTKAKEAFDEEESKQAIETARFKARNQAEMQRRAIKSRPSGGFFSMQPAKQPVRTRFVRRTAKRKPVKRNTYKVVRRVSVPQASPSENLSGLLGSSHKGKKKLGIMNIKL